MKYGITGREVERLRLSYEMTKREFSEALGITHRHLNRIEYGECPVSGPLEKLLERIIENGFLEDPEEP